MKINLTLLSLLLVLLNACNPKVNQPIPNHGLFWKISGNELQQPSYLFGTYHSIDAMQILDSLPNIDSIFNATDQLICESELSANWSYKNNKKVSKKPQSLYKPWPVKDSTYQNLLTEDQKNILDSVLNTNKFLFGIKNKWNVRPTTLLNIYKYEMNKTKKKDSLNKPNYNHIPDTYFQYLAKDRNIEIISLDSVGALKAISDSIINITPQLTYRAEVESLIYQIENYSKIDSLKEVSLKIFLSAYFNQDLQKLIEFYQNPNLFASNCLSTDTACEKLNENFKLKQKLTIDGRNAYWMQQIPSLIQNKSSFIAVGAGHLGGKKGVIHQLRQLGYTVERIN